MQSDQDGTARHGERNMFHTNEVEEHVEDEKKASDAWDQRVRATGREEDRRSRGW